MTDVKDAVKWLHNVNNIKDDTVDAVDFFRKLSHYKQLVVNAYIAEHPPGDEIKSRDAEIDRLRKGCNPECPGCGLHPCNERSAAVLWCDECAAVKQGQIARLTVTIQAQIDGCVCGGDGKVKTWPQGTFSNDRCGVCSALRAALEEKE